MGRWARWLVPLGLVASGAAAQTSVADAVARLAATPDMRFGRLGVEVISLGDGAVRFRRDADRLFVPASTTKLISTGAALALLGPDYRFHTRVCRTGPVRAGVLAGDIVIVASGDANLSGRVQPDGTLAFVDEDHSYGGMPVAGDPVAPLTKLARDIAASGVRRITGTVIVDTSLFAEGDREGGSLVALSPIVVNDNVIDVVVTPGAAGQSVTVAIAPEVAHVRFVNQIVTGAAGSETTLATDVLVQEDGTRRVTLRGSLPTGHAPVNAVYPVDVPSRFAADVLIAALAKAGVTVGRPSRLNPIEGRDPASYRPDALIADLVSPPLSEDMRITLKVSQNAHAGLIPYVIGSVVTKTNVDAKKAGMARIHDWLAGAGLDLSAAMMGDGLGASASFTPDFMVHYLAFMARQPVFATWRTGLPVLGRDGTLADIQKASPAAGAVFAKTGTWTDDDLLNHGVLADKALAGYTSGPGGEPLAFAVFLNGMPLRAKDGVSADERVSRVAGEAVGGIAAAIHLLPVGAPGDPPR